MINDIIREAREVPTRVRERSEQLRGELERTPTVLAERGQEARKWMLRRLHEVRETSEKNLFGLQVGALEAAEELVEKATTMPVLDRVGPSARDLIGAVEKATLLPPLDNYDELNVRQVMAALRDLDHFGLMRVERHETANKNRKTILDAINRESDRRARLVAA